MTHEQLVEEMKQKVGLDDIQAANVLNALTTTAQRVREETIEEIISKLDWRNRKDGTRFHDGSDVVDWYDKILSTLNK